MIQPNYILQRNPFEHLAKMADFTKIYRQDTYATLASSAPANSQKGRTVVVAGASSGIGFAIARSFRDAGAERLIILGRTQKTLNEAASKLGAEARVCDISKAASISSFWDGLRAEGVHVDTLVLNAALTIATPTLQTNIDDIWKSFEINVRSLLEMTQHFIAQMGDKKGHVSGQSLNTSWSAANIPI